MIDKQPDTLLAAAQAPQQEPCKECAGTGGSKWPPYWCSECDGKGTTSKAPQQAAPAVPTRQQILDSFGFLEGAVTETTYLRIVELVVKMLAAAQAPQQAAPAVFTDYQILAITTAYEQGVGKGRQAHESGKEISNPYSTGYRCDLAWQYGYDEGKEQAERIAMAAPQQEVQEPVVAAVFDEQLGRAVIVEGAPLLKHGQPLYTAQPAPSGDAEDAARYRWLFDCRTPEQLISPNETVFNPLRQDEIISQIQGFYMSKADVDTMVDAARKEQSN